MNPSRRTPARGVPDLDLEFGQFCADQLRRALVTDLVRRTLARINQIPGATGIDAVPDVSESSYPFPSSGGPHAPS